MKRFWMLALIALLLIAGAANAETDGSLRVKLKSLGERKRICVNIEGEYLLGGEALEDGANLEFTAQNGFLWANDGAASVRLGKQAAALNACPAGFTSPNPKKTRATTEASPFRREETR